MNILNINPYETPSYTGRIFSDLVEWRDENTTSMISALARRIISQLVLMTLCVIGIAELLNHVRYYITTMNPDREEISGNAAQAWALSNYCMLYNLFVKKISPVFQRKYVDLFPDYKSLWLAVHRGYYTMAQTALKYADPHQKFGLITPTLAQRLHGQTNLQELFPLNSYERQYLKTQLLSHWLELKGEIELEGQKISLEGSRAEGMRQSMIDSLQAFRECAGFSSLSLGDEKATILQEALSHSYNIYTNTKMKKDSQRKECFFMNAGWKRHAICLVFWGDYLCIANGGFGARRHSTLSIYRIDRSCLNQEIFEEIWKNTNSEDEPALDYFYNTLPSKLKGKKDALHDLFQTIAPPLAKTGNCALSSMQIALPFAWGMLLNPSPNPQTLKQAQLESSLFLNWAAVRYVEITQPTKEFQDRAFLSKVASSERQKNKNFVRAFHRLHSTDTKKTGFLPSLFKWLLGPLTACYYLGKPFAWRYFSHFSPKEFLLEN